MSCPLRSPTINSPKPVNIFYIWYAELCRRANVTPLSIVKPAKPKNETVLDFTADRIKAEEWSPILNALRQDTSLHVIAIRSRVECKFLEEVDTERKAREMKRKGGSIYTNYILRSLISALTCVLKRSQVISCLELDGLPVTTEYLEPLLETLAKNKTIKILSLKYCPIRDSGCQQLCMCLRYIPNIEILNLTACGLGSLSAQYIAKVIRYQQINRYCESWHSSLRYEDPDIGIMTGLKRITLNNNPNIGDEGLTHILNELDDDLWIKALDMQKCNITDNISSRLIDVIDYSKSLEVADFRNNEMLSINTVEKIFDILKNKQKFGFESEYPWCLTATTLPFESSLHETTSCSSTIISANIQKCKSVPFKQISKRSSLSSLPVRKIKTFTTMAKSKDMIPKRSLLNLKRSSTAISRQLDKTRSKESTRVDAQLSQKLQNIRSTINKFNEIKEKNVKFDISCNSNVMRTKESLDIKIPYVGAISQDLKNTKETDIKLEESASKSVVSERNSKVEFVFAIEDNKEKDVAQSLFKNLMYKNAGEESDSASEQDILDYFRNQHIQPKTTEETESETASNVSLLKFMEEIKSSTNIECSRQNKKIDSWPKDNTEQNCNQNQLQKVLVKVPAVR
ncbi:Leucine rich repeat [Popillia japonica]|uniref:Leucine rich repeat n=1 Tax=Popillia japonica TaxID=7064 RepID=A0AAW1LA04_POPJA